MSRHIPKPPKDHPFHGEGFNSKEERFQRDLEQALKRREEMLKRFREEKR
ncbi:hypothetical protein OLK001_18640 [Synechocystis sp. LKSZ1]